MRPAHPGPAAGRKSSRHEKIKNSLGHPHMDIEQINAIGYTLADLSQRTEALRGYL